MLPPILEVYVVHHPNDRNGSDIAQQIFAHFHGTSFSGLIGGAVEVYVRSTQWGPGQSNPRPIPYPDDPPPNNVLPARLIAVVPVISVPLARAVRDGDGWPEYIERSLRARAVFPDRVGVFPVLAGSDECRDTRLAELLAPIQRIASPSGMVESEPRHELICRDLAQGIAQMIAGDGSRLQVFISHTRRAGSGEEEDVPALIRIVRDIVRETRLRHFFDATDLQPGRGWEAALRENASKSALLAIRTDLYASRTWCQREMLIAKQSGMPIVILDSLGVGEDRGSFLMDHLPRIPVREAGGAWNKADIRRGLNLLVDECLKRMLWGVQQEISLYRTELRITWWAPHAPEPITLAHWLARQHADGIQVFGDEDVRILHPDPPLGPDEREALREMAVLMNHRGSFEVMTPRNLAARGA